MLWLRVFSIFGDHKLELPEARSRLLSRPAGELQRMDSQLRPDVTAEYTLGPTLSIPGRRPGS